MHRDDAFEARDLENEIEANEDLSDRLHKIERSLANERIHTNELQKTLQSTYSMVDTLKSRLINLVWSIKYIYTVFCTHSIFFYYLYIPSTGKATTGYQSSSK